MTLGLVLPAALLGVGIHLGYFIRGEHHAHNLQFFLAMVLGPPVVWLYLFAARGFLLFQSIKIAVIIVGSFAASLTTSILTYRYLFHPLRRYPGPTGAALSKLWQARRTVSEINTFQLLDDMHRRYGDFVRSGPNELSVIDPDIIDAVYGPQSQCTKSPWYDMSLPITSLHQLRDRALHDRRRREGWAKAFNRKSLRAYDTRVVGFADLLLEKLDGFAGRPVDASEWLNFYSYDVMGSLGFGRSFDMLASGGSHKCIQILQDGLTILKFAGPAVYLCNLATKVPSSMNPITQFNAYSEKCVQERKAKEGAEADILGHLIEHEEFFNDKELDRALLLGDSRLVIVAGSDTTSAALVYTIYHIAKDPSVANKIRAELKEYNIDMHNEFSVPALQDLPYLNGVMNEGLRLHPPVPGGVFRTAPQAGLQIGDRFIPGGTQLLVPIYSLQRSPKNFAEPETFIPERWTTRPDLVINKNAFMPFSAGPYGCIGKHLAMGELRTVITKLVSEFEIRLAPNETGAEMFKNQRDCFTLCPGKLELCFVRRGELN